MVETANYDNGYAASMGRSGAGMRSFRASEMPEWVKMTGWGLGAGAVLGLGLYATRRYWLPWTGLQPGNFAAAFADGETDRENFDQTRHAGREAMRDDPGEEWEEIDDMMDASFPASDPPSFNPGTA